MNGVTIGDIMISGSILVAAIGGTWRIGMRFSKIESKLDSHIAYHDGLEHFGGRRDKE